MPNLKLYAGAPLAAVNGFLLDEQSPTKSSCSKG